MELPQFVPTPEEGLKLLAPLIPHLQPALENALFKSSTYVEAEDLNCDGTTWLTFVRAHAKNYLVRLNLDGVRFKDWALSGIEFEVNDCTFRCWKGTERELPLPGESIGRKRFLNQQYPLPFDGDGLPKIRNFVVLYTIGAANEVTLWLACPKAYLEDERIAEAWWWVRIEDPALSVGGPTNIGAPPETDLPIEGRKIPKVENND